MTTTHLPFNVGQIVEVKSFEEGFRGAWFRCKIRDISKRKTGWFYKLEYLDFPDEKIHTTKLYQKGPTGDKKHLMVRPRFPHVCHRNEAPDLRNVMETTLVVDDSWKVGDLVDWWASDCYWSGTITNVMGDGKVKVELFPVPVGEGEIYDASCDDLRPYLDWSPEEGWIASFSKDGENSGARLIKPASEGKNSCAKLIKATNEGENSRAAMINPENEESECMGRDRKKRKADGSIPLNIMTSTAIEAAALDLEELVTRIKWLKAMLASNSEKSSSATKYSWKFAEYCPTSTTRL